MKRNKAYVIKFIMAGQTRYYKRIGKVIVTAHSLAGAKMYRWDGDLNADLAKIKRYFGKRKYSVWTAVIEDTQFV